MLPKKEILEKYKVVAKKPGEKDKKDNKAKNNKQSTYIMKRIKTYG